MITFVVRAGVARFTHDPFVAAVRDIAPDLRIEVLSIENLATRRRVPRSTWILGDLERYSTREMQFLATFVRALQGADPHARVLNHPTDSLRRHELLVALHDSGMNPFRSHLPDDLDAVRYPAFLRMRREHYLPDPVLLHRPAEARAALRHRRRSMRRLDEYLLIEHVDVRRPDGRYAKYAAYRIGDRIVPEHLALSEHWHVKWSPLLAPDDQREEREYLESHDHAELLRPIFELAGIEYGRVDYSLVDGRPVVWEINTNPVLVEPVELFPKDILDLRIFAIGRLADALCEVDDAREPGAIPIELATDERLRSLVGSAEYAWAFGLRRRLRRRGSPRALARSDDPATPVRRPSRG